MLAEAFVIAAVCFVPADALSHSRWRTREAAHVALARVGELARPALESVRKHSSSHEAKRRAMQLLVALETPERRLRLLCERGTLPWIFLEGSYNNRVTLDLVADAKKGGAVDDLRFLCWREATRLWVREQVRLERRAADIYREIEGMQEEEVRYCYGHVVPKN